VDLTLRKAEELTKFNTRGEATNPFGYLHLIKKNFSNG